VSARPSIKVLRGPSLALALASLAGCASPDEPPGRTIEGPEPPSLPPPPALDAPDAEADALADEGEPEGDAPSPEETEPGGGHKLASIAMRNSVYVSPDYQSTRLGYLRAGAVVLRGAAPVGHKRCKGGWYRIHPRGYVCVGTGATLDVEHPVTQAVYRGPRRGEPFPYDYVISRSPPPPLYVHLPTPAEQHTVEGRPVSGGGMNPWILREIAAVIGEADPNSPFLSARNDLPKPPGAEERVRFSAHRGRAKARSAFGLMATFDWTGRRFGLTTELDLVPLDRTRIVHPSAMHGVEIHDEGVPAFVMHQGLRALRPDGAGKLKPAELVPFRSGWVLTGKASSGGTHRIEGKPGEAPAAYVETTEGAWLAASSLRVGRLAHDLWGHAKRGKRWIDVSIDLQMLVAYEGTRPVFATLVSTGRGGLGDPETTGATVQGTFFVQSKHVTATMDGDPASEAAFELHDVPYIQYFHQNYALHGAYWHDAFGKARSNGCVNLSPADAAWLFEFTDPPVPTEWHGAMNPVGGTLVYVHP
jgi:lipoprotein-anchoring transpeptidase ErfK/SrfK